MNIQWLGLTSYKPTWEMQRQLVDQRIKGEIENQLILCEHQHVYTFGKSADHKNLLIQPDFLKKIGAETYEIERGGDITYHGPGQLVGYPILNLHEQKMGVKAYVELIEQSLIHTLREFEIVAERIPGLTGIWINAPIPRKIAAIGIKVTRGVTMHGFALNVNTDLSYYHHIIPCGISDKEVTSMAKELGSTIEMNKVINTYSMHFQHLLQSQQNL